MSMGPKNHAAADGECLLLSGGSGLDLSLGGLTDELGLDFVPALSSRGCPA
jgi:hypothetical protein